MQIENSTQNFKANLIATSGKRSLYKVTDSADIIALKKFSKKTDFKTLMPQNSKTESDRWHEMLEYAIDMAENPGNVTYVESFNNKLCGIITYFPNSTTTIDCICTIPVQIGEKVKLAGKTLFYQVFKDFLDNKGSRIKLSAITNGPYNTINKYADLGFKETTDSTATYVNMSANQYKIKEAMKLLNKIIPYKSENKKVRLEELI